MWDTAAVDHPIPPLRRSSTPHTCTVSSHPLHGSSVLLSSHLSQRIDS